MDFEISAKLFNVSNQRSRQKWAKTLGSVFYQEGECRFPIKAYYTNQSDFNLVISFTLNCKFPRFLSAFSLVRQMVLASAQRPRAENLERRQLSPTHAAKARKSFSVEKKTKTFEKKNDSLLDSKMHNSMETRQLSI